MTDTQQQLKERFDLLPKVVQDAITSAEVEEHLRKLSRTHQLHLDQWQELETEVMLTLMGIKPIGALAANIKNMVRVDDVTARALAQSISEIVFAPIRAELDAALAKFGARRDAAGEPILDLSDDIQKSVRSPNSSFQEPALPAAPPLAEHIDLAPGTPPSAVIQGTQSTQTTTQASTPPPKQETQPLDDEALAQELAALDAEHGTPDADTTTPAAAATTPVTSVPEDAEPTPLEKPKVTRTEVPETYKSGTPSSGRRDVHNDPYRETPNS